MVRRKPAVFLRNFPDNMTPDHLPSQALDMRNIDKMACMSQAEKVWA